MRRRLRFWRTFRGRRLLVHLTSGATIEGLLADARGGVLVLVLPGRGQAFVELANVDYAETT